jgi:hypothetical protein
MKTSAEERKHLSVVLMGSHLCPTLEGPTRAPKLINHIIRSHWQYPATTCNSSVVGPHRRVRVRGCPSSSVAVDVPIDVGWGAPRSLAPTVGFAAAAHLILGQVLFHHDLRSDHRSCMLGLCGIPSAWRSPTTRWPGGNVLLYRRPSLPCLPPGHRVVALGEVDGMPHPYLLPGSTLVSAILEACRSAGRRAPAVGSAEPSVRLSTGRQPAN